MEHYEVIFQAEPDDAPDSVYLGEFPEAVKEPQFISFQCSGCGGQHADLDNLIFCNYARIVDVRQITAVVVA